MHSRPPPPSIVQEFIRKTATRDEAVRILKDELDWLITLNRLSDFVTRYDLKVSWRRQSIHRDPYVVGGW